MKKGGVIARGESTLKRLVIGAHFGSADASCKGSLLLLSIFTFVDSPTVMGTSTKREKLARFSSLRSRARGESALKRLVIGAHSGSSNANCVASLLLQYDSNSCSRTPDESTLKRLVKCAGSGSSNWSRVGRTLCVEFRVFVRVVPDETISVFRENTSLGSIDVIIVAVLKGGRRRREGEGKEASVYWKN